MQTDKLQATPFGGSMKNITHVLTNPQDLSEERKRQARENIDAAWGAVVPADADETNLLVSTTTMNTVIDEKLANFGGFAVVPLTERPPYVPDPSSAEPEVQLSNKIIYLTKDASAGKTDPYTEWIYSGDPSVAVDPTKWEVIGEASPDMDSKEDKENKVSSWSSTPTDEHYPSEKLVKDELDTKANAADMETALAGKVNVTDDYIKTAEKSQDNKTLTLTRSDTTQVTFSGVPGVIQGDNGKVLMAGNDGYSWESIPDPDTKADKCVPSSPGNLAGLTFDGNLYDAGIAVDQLAQIPDEYTEGNLAALDEHGNLTDAGVSATDVVAKLHTHDNKTGLDRIPNDLPEASQQLNNEFMLYTDVSQAEPTVSWMRWDTITVEDPQLYIAGRRYRTATIGNQTWMVENLATESVPGWWYDDGSQFDAETNGYGKLYDWESAMQLNVVGWHLPTVDDYQELFNYLQTDNTVPLFANESIDGFNAVYAGYRYSYEDLGGIQQAFMSAGTAACLWTATADTSHLDAAYVVWIESQSNNKYRIRTESRDKACIWASVRLVKDR